MPYVPSPPTTAQCAHCGNSFEKKHASRKYCSNTCNVKASNARTGYREGRTTRADLEQALARMTELVERMTGQPAPAAKAAATKPKPAEKAVSTVKKRITTPAPAAEAAATKPKKKITATPIPKEEQLHQAQLKAGKAAMAKAAQAQATTEQPRDPREVYRR